MANNYKRTSTEELTAMADSIREAGTFTEGQTFVFPSSEYDQNPTKTYWIYTNEWIEKTEEEATALVDYTEVNVLELPTIGESNILYILYTFQIGFAEAYQKVIDEFYQKVYHGTLTQEDIDGLIFDQKTRLFCGHTNSSTISSFPTITEITITSNFLKYEAPRLLTRLTNLKTVNVNNSNNEDIIIPHSICTHLTNLEKFKCSPTIIGAESFDGCYNLILEADSLQLNKCTTLKAYCFMNTGFNAVSLPACTTIEQSAFYNNKNLISVYLPNVPPTLENVNAFEIYIQDTGTFTVNSNLKFYVPSGSKTLYASATNWASFIDGSLDGIDHFEEVVGGDN